MWCAIPLARDYDRIIFSSSFQAGQESQVHPLVRNDHIHNRLTHSLEVSSVRRSLGLEVGQTLADRGHLPDGFSQAPRGPEPTWRPYDDGLALVMPVKPYATGSRTWPYRAYFGNVTERADFEALTAMPGFAWSIRLRTRTPGFRLTPMLASLVSIPHSRS